MEEIVEKLMDFVNKDLREKYNGDIGFGVYKTKEGLLLQFTAYSPIRAWSIKKQVSARWAWSKDMVLEAQMDIVRHELVPLLLKEIVNDIEPIAY